jgi:hypothetical protein
VICGRSIYTGALDFSAAQLRADELGAQSPCGSGRRPGRLAASGPAASAPRARIQAAQRTATSAGMAWWASRAVAQGAHPQEGREVAGLPAGRDQLVVELLDQLHHGQPVTSGNLVQHVPEQVFQPDAGDHPCRRTDGSGSRS